MRQVLVLLPEDKSQGGRGRLGDGAALQARWGGRGGALRSRVWSALSDVPQGRREAAQQLP